MIPPVKCEIEGCAGKASVFISNPHPMRVCTLCHTDILASKFPRASVMLQSAAVAGVLRQAAIDLEALASEAPFVEVGTLRRRARGIVLGAMAFAEGTISEAES